jgi:small-conductance mechanosensitive channel
MSSLVDQIATAFTELGRSLIGSIPRVAVGVALLALALLVAKVAERILRRMFVRVRFDEILVRAGIDQMLGRIGVRESMNHLIPRLSYYLLLFLFIRTAAHALGLAAISEAIGTLLGYLPNLVAAILILVLGSVAAQFVGRTVARVATDSGIDFAESLGSLVSSVMIFVLGIVALSQLKIDTEMVRVVTTCLLAGAGLAFGLSFGLGTRDITRNIVAGFYARKVFRAGQPLEVRGQRGILRSITPTQTILEGEDGIVAVGNSVFLDEVVKQ